MCQVLSPYIIQFVTKYLSSEHFIQRYTAKQCSVYLFTKHRDSLVLLDRLVSEYGWLQLTLLLIMNMNMVVI